MKIAILEPLGVPTEDLRSRIVNRIGEGHELVFYPDRNDDEATLVARSQGADTVVLSNIPYRRIVMEKCPELKRICVAFTGMDHIDLAYCAERGIEVKNCAGYSTVAVADLVFGLVLSLARNIPACNVVCREQGTKAGLVGFELSGKKFGILGLGASSIVGTFILSVIGACALIWVWKNVLKK